MSTKFKQKQLFQFSWNLTSTKPPFFKWNWQLLAIMSHLIIKRLFCTCHSQLSVIDRHTLHLQNYFYGKTKLMTELFFSHSYAGFPFELSGETGRGWSTFSSLHPFFGGEQRWSRTVLLGRTGSCHDDENEDGELRLAAGEAFRAGTYVGSLENIHYSHESCGPGDCDNKNSYTAAVICHFTICCTLSAALPRCGHLPMARTISRC